MAAAVEPEAAARGQLRGRLGPSWLRQEGGLAGEQGGGQVVPEGALRWSRWVGKAGRPPPETVGRTEEEAAAGGSRGAV